MPSALKSPSGKSVIGSSVSEIGSVRTSWPPGTKSRLWSTSSTAAFNSFSGRKPQLKSFSPPAEFEPCVR